MVSLARLVEFIDRVNLHTSAGDVSIADATDKALAGLEWSALAELRDSVLLLQQYIERKMLEKGGR